MYVLSLFGDRKVFYDVYVLDLLEEHLLQILPIVRGSMKSTIQQEQSFHHVAWTDWYTLGELIQRFQPVLRGSINSKMLILEREYLGSPFALDVKGGE